MDYHSMVFNYLPQFLHKDTEENWYILCCNFLLKTCDRLLLAIFVTNYISWTMIIWFLNMCPYSLQRYGTKLIYFVLQFFVKDLQQVMNYYGMVFNYLPELLYKDTEKKLIYCKILLIPVNNYEYILHIAWSKECRNTCFILEKRKKNRLHIDVFFLPNITPPLPP